MTCEPDRVRGRIAEGLAEAGVTEFTPSQLFTTPEERAATRAVLLDQIAR